MEVSRGARRLLGGSLGQVCPTRRIQSLGAAEGKETPSIPRHSIPSPESAPGPPTLEKGFRSQNLGCGDIPSHGGEVETCGPSRAALSVLGRGRTGPSAPSLPPPPPVFLSQSVAGIPWPALRQVEGNPHLPAYCAFERLLLELETLLSSSPPTPTDRERGPERVST